MSGGRSHGTINRPNTSVPKLDQRQSNVSNGPPASQIIVKCEQWSPSMGVQCEQSAPNWLSGILTNKLAKCQCSVSNGPRAFAVHQNCFLFCVVGNGPQTWQMTVKCEHWSPNLVNASVVPPSLHWAPKIASFASCNIASKD